MICIRSLCIVLVIFIILSGLVLSEQLLIRGFCHDISKKLLSAEKDLSAGDIPRDSVVSAVKIWETKKVYVFIFSNHSNFREIENNIYNLEFYSKHSDIKKSQFYVDVLIHRVQELKESCRIKKENIL